jgi:glycosyltransferase involved in cell wall biosynthesis
MSERRLKIAYLCETSPKIKWAHSGGNTRIYNSVKKHIGDVTILDSDWGMLEFVRFLINKLPHAISMRLRFRVHVLLAPLIAIKVTKMLKKQKYDVLFCSYSFFSLAGLKLPYPLMTVFTSDATYTAYKYSEVGEKFGSYFPLSRIFDSCICSAELKVYRHADLLLWPSQWIKDAADSLYGLSNENSRLIHWGANITPPKPEDILLTNPIEGQVRMLLVGRDWFPKGGPMVFEVLEELIKRGINAHLTVVGCTPPDFHMNQNMTVYPQLDKSIPEEYETFTSLYKNSHFFVMPSYEAYGFAFCEAGAYALPALCLRVGGVPIKEDINGNALPAQSTADLFASKIESYVNNENRYQQLRRTTRSYYQEHLHWDAWGEKAKQLILEKLEASNAKIT